MKNSIITFRCRIILWIITLAILLMATMACHVSTSNKGNQDYFLLGLVGYNYTDRHISVYSVDGIDGGHINLSSPTSGGSGITCCARFSKKKQGPVKVKVRWQVDGCLYLIKDDETGKVDTVRHFYFRESEVNVHREGGDPNYVETHFFKDGTVQVRLTDSGSDPFIVLNEKRPDKSYFPKCKNDKKPAE